ncbi:hypothetical protein L6452_35288 [Arctium lappa]|uniref:Uncharacterized protein n=1 Tax=Arctium lappa TaxID=4217 RepID=A0ACB8Y5A0_ARCLA|nr:hypothetical protein L6452_35288 [Arctium lappa]
MGFDLAPKALLHPLLFTHQPFPIFIYSQNILLYSIKYLHFTKEKSPTYEYKLNQKTPKSHHPDLLFFNQSGAILSSLHNEGGTMATRAINHSPAWSIR